MKLRDRRHAAGLCWQCDTPVVPGLKRCAPHLKKSIAITMRYNRTPKGVARSERRKPVDAKWRRKNRRASGRFKYVRAHAIRRGFEWALSESEYKALIAQPCHYCVLPSDVEAGVGLDRLDNSQGYLPTNVVPACTLCNVTRANRFTHDEMLIIGRAIAEVRQQRQLERLTAKEAA